MAKEIDSSLAILIDNIQNGSVSIMDIDAIDAVILSTRGYIDLNDDHTLSLNPKAVRALKRFKKHQEIMNAVEDVRLAIDKVLDEPGKTTQHRALWTEVGGPAKYSRDTVLQALIILKNEGVLSDHKTGGNNFQHYWKRTEDNPTVPSFDIN